MNKKGEVLQGYVIALLTVGFIISGFIGLGALTVFWNAYNFNMTTTTATSLDQTNNVSLAVKSAICDINPEDVACKDIQRSSLSDTGSKTLTGILQGGYGTMLTILNTIGITEDIFINLGNILQLDPMITAYLTSIVFILISITIVLIIFGRYFFQT